MYYQSRHPLPQLRPVGFPQSKPLQKMPTKISVFCSEKIYLFFPSNALVGGVGGNFGFSYMRFIFLLNLFYFLQLLQNTEKIIMEY